MTQVKSFQTQKEPSCLQILYFHSNLLKEGPFQIEIGLVVWSGVLDFQITQFRFSLQQIKALALKYVLELSNQWSQIFFILNMSTSSLKRLKTLYSLKSDLSHLK